MAKNDVAAQAVSELGKQLEVFVRLGGVALVQSDQLQLTSLAAWATRSFGARAIVLDDRGVATPRTFAAALEQLEAQGGCALIWTTGKLSDAARNLIFEVVRRRDTGHRNLSVLLGCQAGQDALDSAISSKLDFQFTYSPQVGHS